MWSNAHVHHHLLETGKSNAYVYPTLASLTQVALIKWIVLMGFACSNVYRTRTVHQMKDVRTDNVCWLVDWTTIASLDTFAWTTCVWLVARLTPIAPHLNHVLEIDALILALMLLLVDPTQNAKVRHNILIITWLGTDIPLYEMYEMYFH